MAEPTDNRHRDLIEAAAIAIANMSPSDVLPSNHRLGEQLARAVSRKNTRHQVIRLIGSTYGLDAAVDGSAGPSEIETTLALHMARFAEEFHNYRPETLPRAIGKLAEDYFDAYASDLASLSRWMLYCAIATVPGELPEDDERDRQAFQDALATWIKRYTDRYIERYGALVFALGRTEREDGALLSFTQLLGMLSEGAFIRVAIDPALDHDKVRTMYRQAVLGLVGVFSAGPGDDRTIDELVSESLVPPVP